MCMDKRQERLNRQALSMLRKQRLAEQREKLTRINTYLLSKTYPPSVLDDILRLLE